MSEGGARLAVLAGGGLGSLGRWWIDGSLPAAGPGWGWATLTVNVTGALAMGMLVAWLSARVAHPLARPFAAVGLLGGWTTYSTFALDAHSVIGADGVVPALGYVITTLVLGVGASLTGLLVGERWFDVRPEMAEHLIDEEEL
ncbi:fluoride efflux transporter FluC [Janibacter alittae]|uniref:Fluoride-specific ion channel FluC n=1 Tax=Janibacter alittae TaxID=3115209 RepID=A0ABZ2MFU2_9MICO